ncbi:MAG: hypothetical protein Q9157_008543 [Trypethelium eluteriae]
MLAFVYWHDDKHSTHEAAFNNVTVAGCVIGMVFFGVLADIFGRRKMYGFQLIIVIVGTMGVVMSSTGYIPIDQTNSQAPGSIDFSSFGSMNIESWLLFWRFLSGIGIGAEYPLSAVIAAEFSPTTKRARILAIVFAMQAAGIAAVAIVSLIVTKAVQRRHPYNPEQPETSARAVDQIWRWVFGLSLLPALVTAIMRFTIPESPRYTLDVLNDPLKASKETDRLKGFTPGSEVFSQSDTAVNSRCLESNEEEIVTNGGNSDGPVEDGDAKGLTMRQYFWIEGNWRYLFATSAIWLLMDFSTYFLGVNETQQLSKFWYGPTVLVKSPSTWDSNTVDPKVSIFSVLIENSVHLLVIESITSNTGSILLVLFISRLNRKLLAWATFLATGILLIVTGASLLATIGSQSWGVSIALYSLCKFADAFGPSPLTFLLPAEIFPTTYRASCHGISAASGKVGALLASVLLEYITFGRGSKKITESASPTAWLGYVLIVFAIPMFIGAGIGWLYIPELQHPSGESKTLEQLAEGRQSERSESMRDLDMT